MESFEQEFLVRLVGNTGHNVTKHQDGPHYLLGRASQYTTNIASDPANHVKQVEMSR